MPATLPSEFVLANQVLQALKAGNPVVALESTVITHGLPYPDNLKLALDMEEEVRRQGAQPATVGVLDGKIFVGLQREQLQRLAEGRDLRKISSRDFAAAIIQGASGGTTVAGTLMAAHLAGVRVLATGGIGGVHKQPAYDVSADLFQLAQTPMLVVCAGAKAVLDLAGTLEYLETYNVPVVGYCTEEFPAFYSVHSGLKCNARVDSPQEAAALARRHWSLGIQSAVLLAQPLPEREALSAECVEGAIQQALRESQESDIRGPKITPYLLRRVAELTDDASLRANLALLRNNASLAAQVARCLVELN